MEGTEELGVKKGTRQEVEQRIRPQHTACLVTVELPEDAVRLHRLWTLYELKNFQPSNIPEVEA